MAAKEMNGSFKKFEELVAESRELLNKKVSTNLRTS